MPEIRVPNLKMQIPDLPEEWNRVWVLSDISWHMGQGHKS